MRRRIPTSIVVAYAVCVDYLVYGLVLPLIPFSGVGLGKHQQIVLLAGAYAVGVFVAALGLSRYGDRFGYRRTMIGAALMLVLATIALVWARSAAVMIGGRVAQGIAAGATFSAGFSLLAQHYRERRIEVMSIAFIGSTVGSVAGPALGGWLYVAGGYRLPFWVVFGLLALELVGLVALLPHERSLAPDQPAARGLLLERGVAVPLVAVALAASAWGILEPLVPYHLQRSSNASAAQIGTVMTLATIAYGAAAPLVAAAARRSISLTMLFGALGMAVTLPAVAASSGLVAVGFTLCAGNVAYAFLLNPTSAQLADALDARALRCYSTVYSISNFAYSFGMIGGSAAAYTLLARLSFFHVMLAVGVALLFGAALIAFASQRRSI
jgi:MFS transporter, DHA1 family, solute carrier family 18 (vesicular amine transporter), member 1/2